MICSKDFFNKSDYNQETKEQLWASIIQDAHDSICRCHQTYAHLLSIIFPLGHQDRNLSINQILLRDYREKCRSGGGAGDATGFLTEKTTIPDATEEKEQQEEDTKEEISDLLAAVAAAEGEVR